MVEVRNIPLSASKQDIERLFSSFAPISQVIIDSCDSLNENVCYIVVNSFFYAQQIISSCNCKIPFPGCKQNMIVKLANVKPAESQAELGDCISSPNSISSASS